MTRSGVPQGSAPTPALATPRRLASKPGLWLVLGIFGGLALVLGLSIWRVRDVSDLPDIGDPVDLASICQPIVVVDNDNAFALYSQARSKLGKVTQGESTALRANPTWSSSGPNLKEFLRRRRPALELCARKPNGPRPSITSQGRRPSTFSCRWFRISNCLADWQGLRVHVLKKTRRWRRPGGGTAP